MHKGYDWFIDDNPKIKKRVAKGRAEGRAEGRVEGEMKALQATIITLIKLRFPSLETLAQQKVAHINDVKELNHMVAQVTLASSEAEVREMLGAPVA